MVERTRNGKVHSATRHVPKVEWLKEREYLVPLKLHQGATSSFMGLAADMVPARSSIGTYATIQD